MASTSFRDKWILGDKIARVVRGTGPLGMARCGWLAPALLLHTNLLLAVYAGGALATAARLKWDPSAYVLLRELLPFEYRVTAVALLAAAAALLVLVHLAALALVWRRRRRPLLLTYAALMVCLGAAELGLAAWMAVRLVSWVRSEPALTLSEVLELRNSLRPALELLARWHPLPGKIVGIIEEAEADVPRNLWAAAGAGGLLAVLQMLAVALSLVAALRPARERRASLSCASAETELPSDERAPLRTAYRGGRIVVV